MKKISLFFALTVLLAGPKLSVAQEVAAPVVKETKASQVSSVVPHRALYKVTLGKVKHDSGLREVNGTMLFDMGDACDGWTVHQYMKMHFAYNEGDEDELSSSIVTWEAKDAQSFLFNVKRVVGGKEDEGYKGRTTLGGHGGVAHYTYPLGKEDIIVPDGALFPIAHTNMILAKAKIGEKLFTRRVFDGSDDEGSAEVSAFISPRLTDASESALPQELRQNPLIAGQGAWPVRLAFYPPTGQNSEPDYEMELVLQENGVARSMVIDYGEFSVAGALVKLEPARAISCGPHKETP